MSGLLAYSIFDSDTRREYDVGFHIIVVLFDFQITPFQSNSFLIFRFDRLSRAAFQEVYKHRPGDTTDKVQAFCGNVDFESGIRAIAAIEIS